MVNKISNRFNIQLFIFFIFSTFDLNIALAQEINTTKPAVIGKYADYRELVMADSGKKMVELKSLMPNLVYDLRYAGVNNFMHRLMYPRHTTITFLRSPAAYALQQVQQELNHQGLGIKIFDAYRPYSVTVKFWELVKDERYVANPAKGSGHNRGIAVDLTIIHLDTGEELPMGTGFDNFTDTAHHDFKNLPATILNNRLFLKNIMENHGFKAFDTEWWHYFLANGDRFEILDIDFNKLNRAR